MIDETLFLKYDHSIKLLILANYDKQKRNQPIRITLVFHNNHKQQGQFAYNKRTKLNSNKKTDRE